MGKMIGESIKRVEDHRFITGTGEYTDDIVSVSYTHLTLPTIYSV